MRKVLFDEAAELGVKTFPIDIWLLSPPPKIELDVPGVEGWAMMFAQWGILLRGGNYSGGRFNWSWSGWKRVRTVKRIEVRSRHAIRRTGGVKKRLLKKYSFSQCS